MTGPFESKYNDVMNAIESKLKTDARMKVFQPLMDIQRGSPVDAPQYYPICYISEGTVSDIVWDSHNALMTVGFMLEIYIKSRDKVEGIKEIRQRVLKTFDTLVGTISDRRLEVNGISLADGENGVKIINCDFGHFSPTNNEIVYRGIIEVEINVEVPLT